MSSPKREKKRQILAEPPFEEEVVDMRETSNREIVHHHSNSSGSGDSSNNSSNGRSSSPISDIMRNQHILEANYLEATKGSPCNVIDEASSSGKRQKSRQYKNELSSLLMYLFGALLLIGWLPEPTAQLIPLQQQWPLVVVNSTPSVLFANKPEANNSSTAAATATSVVVSVTNSSVPSSASLVVRANSNKTIISEETIKKVAITNEITATESPISRDQIDRSSAHSSSSTPSLLSKLAGESANEENGAVTATLTVTAAPAPRTTAISAPTPITTSSATTVVGAPTTASDNDEDDIEEIDDGGHDESGSAAAVADNNKISVVLLGTVGEAADQLVGRAKAASEAANSNNDQGEGAEETAEEERGEEGSQDSIEDNEIAKKRQATVRAQGEALKQTSNSSSSGKSAQNLTEQQEQVRFAFETYGTWRASADDLIELFSKKLLPVVVEHGYDVDPVTVTGFLQVFNGIRAIKPWALKLIDASAKITPGLLMGTQSDFGDFDECLNIRVDDPSGLVARAGVPDEIDPETGLRPSTLIGRYCLADIEFPKAPRRKLSQRNEELQTDYAPIELRRPLLNFSETADFKDTIFVETGNFLHMLYVDPIRVGICLTNKIDPDSLAKVVSKILDEFKVTINFHGRCVTKYDKLKWTVQQTVSAYVLVVASSLVALSTLLDILHSKLNKLPLPESLDKWKLQAKYSLLRYRPLFTSFSIIRNTRRLFEPYPSATLSLAADEQHQRLANQHLFTNLSLATTTTATTAARAANSNCSIAAPYSMTDTSLSAVSNSISSSSSTSSSESSPSTEGRSFTSGSALNLIKGPSSSVANQSPLLDCAQQGQAVTKSNNNNKSRSTTIGNKRSQLAQFETPTTGITADSSTELTSAAADKRRANNLLCLHGVRVITMTWMIVNHTYLFGGFFVLWAHRRLIDIAEWPKSISFQLVLNGWLTVETYFFLSAAIIVMGTMPLMKANKFAYFPYIAHRLVRLLPAYVGLVCLNFLWPLVSSGPVWLVKGQSFIQAPCENYLWANFLFISNWLWPEKQCMVHTWFLSADFQLYLLAPMVVYLLYRRPVLGHSLNIIVAIFASIFSGFVIYANKLMPTTLVNKLEFDSIKQQLSYSYFATYQHMGPYCLGIFIGYTLYKRPQVRLPKYLTWLLWLLLPPLSFTTLLLTYLWNGAYDDPELINPSPIVSAFYVAIHRTIWISLLAWIVFACATGRAKLMSNFLSHQFFVPLSRLSFSIYLVHLPVILFRALNLRYTVEWSDSNILWEACGNFIASIAVGYFVNITFETPIINLERFFCGRFRPTLVAVAAQRNARSVRVSSQSNSMKTTTLLQPTLRPTLLEKETPSGSSEDEFPSDSAQSPSSFELKRKLSPSDCLTATTISANYDSQQQQPSRWLGEGLTASAAGGRRGSLRPKLASRTAAEKMFGGQMEPLEAPVRRGQVELEPVGQQRESLGQSNRRRSMSARDATFPSQINISLDCGDNDDGDEEQTNNIYPMSSEFQHYSRAGFHLPRVSQPSRDANRVPQYATLSRLSRFKQQNQNPHLSERLGYQRSSVLAGGASSHSGDPISSRSSTAVQWNHEQQRWNQQEEQQQAAPAGFRQRIALNQRYLQQRHPGRYNTMTGSGTKEWMREFNSIPADGDDEFQRENWQFGQLSQSSPARPALPANCLQLGALIPRIDSSTLRRHSNAMRPEQANSIAEEREDSASDDKKLNL